MTELLKNALDLFYEKKYDEAVEKFLEMEKEDDQNARLLNNIGLCYANLGDYEKAHWYYGKAIALDPKQAQTYVNEADLLFKEHKILDAIELLQNLHRLMKMRLSKYCRPWTIHTLYSGSRRFRSRLHQSQLPRRPSSFLDT